MFYCIFLVTHTLAAGLSPKLFPGILDSTESLGSNLCLQILQKYNKHLTGELDGQGETRDNGQSHRQAAGNSRSACSAVVAFRKGKWEHRAALGLFSGKHLARRGNC